jgi:hypothetical protein
MFAAIAALALTGAPACWDVYDEAMRHRASAPVPAYVTYNLRTDFTEDGRQLVRAFGRVAYRADGMARVEDDRYPDFTWVTDHVEPGPPAVGSVGNRQSWLPGVDSGSPMHVIGSVRAHQGTCTIADAQPYRGYSVYHLIIGGYAPDTPGVRALWIDQKSSEIWKVVVSGRLFFINGPPGQKQPLTDFAIELHSEGSYLVVDHVTWEYEMKFFSQYSDLFGEYFLSDFAFPKSLPSSLFVTAR